MENRTGAGGIATRSVRIGGALLALLIGCAGLAQGDPSADLTPEQARERWRSRLDGLHFQARIRLVIEERGESFDERRLSVWRDDEGAARERLIARFRHPADLRGVALLYLERDNTSSDYFLYRPEARRIRRIPEDLAREDTYGLDLEHLGFDVAGNEPIEVESLRSVELDGRRALELVERATIANPRFDRRTIWLDPNDFTTIRTEYIQLGRTTVIGTTVRVETVQGVPTPMHIRFERPVEDRVVDLYVDEIDYEKPIDPSVFSAVNLLKR